MAFKSALRVREKTSNKSADGSDPHDLDGVRLGFMSFGVKIGDTHTCEYVASEVDPTTGLPTGSGAWERCIGRVTLGSPNTLSRLYCLENSNDNTTFIDWSATGVNASPDVAISENPLLSLLGYGPIFPVASNDAYHRPITAPQTWSAASISAGQFYLAPFIIPRPVLLKRLRVHVASGQGVGNMLRLGFYRQVGFGVAGMTRVHWEEINIGASAGIKATPSDLDIILDSGIYWSGVNFEAPIATTAHGCGSGAQVNAFGSSVLGYSSSSNLADVTGLTGVNIDIGAYASAALPSTITPTGNRTANTPLVEAKFGEP